MYSPSGYRTSHVLRRVCCVQLEEDLRVLRHEIRQSGEIGVQLPVNFRRLIWNAQKIFKCKPHRPGPSGIPHTHHTVLDDEHSSTSQWNQGQLQHCRRLLS